MNRKNLLSIKRPIIIGMIHLPPLPGYAAFPGMDKVIKKALFDLRALEHGDVDAVMVENEYDRPHKVTVGPETIAAMTTVTQAVVKRAKQVVVGVEILLNDPKASLAVAKAADARFIRTDYFVDRMKRDEYEGEMAIDPKELIAYRKNIRAQNVLILADIQVKYAVMREQKTIAQSAKEAQQNGADAVVVTGTKTGEAPLLSEVVAAKKAVGNYPVLIGSGIWAENAQELLSACDGAIIGTAFKNGKQVDEFRVKRVVEQV